MVFTLPAALAQVVWQNQRCGYTWLFRAASETLREVAASPKHLGAQVGLVAVLHTWGQDLHYHPPLHVVATGGGLACTATGTVTTPPRWVTSDWIREFMASIAVSSRFGSSTTINS